MGAAQVRGRGAAAEGERQLQLVAQQLEHALGALGAGDREPPDGRAADEDRVGAESQGDGDVGAAADAAVDEDGGPACDRLDHLRQGVGAGQNAIELTAAVVGDDDAGGAVLDGERRVLGAQHALDHQRQAALGGDGLEIPPIQGRVHQRERLLDRHLAVTPRAARTLGTPRPSGILNPVRRSRSRRPPGGASTVTTIASKPASTASSISARVTPLSRKQ